MIKHPCTVCCKPVKSRDHGILCDRCVEWTHAACCGVSTKEYNHLTSLGDSQEWLCPKCCLSTLPFADASHLSISSILDTSITSTSSSSDPVHTSLVSATGTNTGASTPSTPRNCCLFNARSIVNKRLDLKALLNTEDLDVVAVTETFLCDEILDSELVDATYAVFRRDRNRKGGGVMLLVRNTIGAVRRHDLETGCEVLWVELSRWHQKTLFGVFYRPPDSQLDILTQLQFSLEGIKDTHRVVLCGDFNVPDINWLNTYPTKTTPHTSLLCDITLQFSLSQLVMEPTRGTNILDLVLTNDENLVHSVSVMDGIPGSDHNSVKFSISGLAPPPSHSRHTRYNYRKADFHLFRSLLGNIPWECCFLEGGVDVVWERLKDILFTCLLYTSPSPRDATLSRMPSSA